ncbi:MAG TPA: DUF4139 domain-containing protein [Rhodocyclaceae bacterium]|nr:DUF4139 domain-containing protein [Rhodocyclaceae bacterium]
MNTLLKFGLASLLLGASLCGYSAIGQVPVTDVILFPGGATVVRTAQVTQGMSRLTIEGVPARFDVQTLRVEASAGIRIGEVVTANVAKSEAANPAEAELEKKIAGLKDQLALLDVDTKAAQLVVDYLGKVAGGETDSGAARNSSAVNAGSVTGVVNAISGEATKAFARMQKVSIQARVISAQLGALERDLEKLRTGARDTRTITVNFVAEHAGTMKVSYQVDSAGWKPSYRANLNSETSVLELERLAVISQKTGENWSNVRLTLSTSRPRQAMAGREPQPWLLSYRVPEPSTGKELPLAYKAAAAPAPAARAGVSSSKAAAEPYYAPPTFEIQNAYSSEFQVPGRSDVQPDGREVLIALNKQEITVKQYLQTTPRQEAAAYLTVEAEKPEGDWPAGDMQLFLDGTYVGSNYWNYSIKDRLLLGFGRDDKVHVSVTNLKSDASSTGVFDKRRQKQIKNILSVANHHRKQILLTVLEPSPVSTADEVRVSQIFEPKPDKESWDDKRGIVAWELKLAPGQGTKIKTDYQIDFPAEGMLIDQR